ncbi:MAG: hypothetical protein WCL50_08610 [Spirochaetota bacterium]
MTRSRGYHETSSKKLAASLRFGHPEIPEIINLKPEGKLAKRYQVEQVRKILVRLGMKGA